MKMTAEQFNAELKECRAESNRIAAQLLISRSELEASLRRLRVLRSDALAHHIPRSVAPSQP